MRSGVGFMNTAAELTRMSLVIVLCYLCGSVPWGFLFGKLFGVDLRRAGSGNIGATNAMRVLGKPVGVTVLLLDVLKGFIAAKWIPHWLLSSHCPEWAQLAGGLASVLGHNFPVWLGFKGGKGIATSTGVMLALFPAAVGICAVAWFVTLLIWRYVSVASIAAALLLPVAIAWTGGSSTMIAFGVLLTVLAIYRHRSNIQRLITGTEPKFSWKQHSGPAAGSSSQLSRPDSSKGD